MLIRLSDNRYFRGFLVASRIPSLQLNYIRMQFCKRLVVAGASNFSFLRTLPLHRLLRSKQVTECCPLFINSSLTGVRTASCGAGLDPNRKYIPRRTLMYVPGADLKKMRKIPDLGVDCAVLECEDGVALNKKAEARENVRVMLDELGEVHGTDLAVRVNSVSSGLMEEDLRVIMAAQRLPATILLPKTNNVDDIILFTDRLKSALGGGRENYHPNLIIYVESAEALMNMKDVLNRAETLSQKGIYRLDGVVFGSDDFCADIGAMRSVDATELTYARQKVVMIAKAYRIQAIDMVFTDVKDLDGLWWQSEQGARMGYTGKQVIHPNQVPVVRKAYTPSADCVEWAKELVAAFEQHQQGGLGAFTFRGNMVDMPLLLQARNILQTISNVHKS